MRNIVLSAVGLMGLSACFGEPVAPQGYPIEVQRFYADTFQDAPFDVGAVSVLTEEHGELHTYQLRPCLSGTRICGSRTGALERTADHFIVRGAYPGRTFYLSAGGGGYLLSNGRQIQLAWNE